MTWNPSSVYNKNRRMGKTMRKFPNGDDPRKKELFGETKKCTTCKEVKDVFRYNWKRRSNPKGKVVEKLQGQCGPCRTLQKNRKYNSDPHSFVYRKFQQIKQDSAVTKKDRKPSTLEIDQLMNIWQGHHTKFGLKCAISGKQMTFTAGKGKVSTNISIDRIDSKKNYEYGNIQFICHNVNSMKNNMEDNELIDWCKSIVNNNDHR